MCTFRWWAIATTNFDLLVERAYQKGKAVQIPVPFVENGDRVEDNLRNVKNVPLLKLHGCITRTTNKDCPLILSTDQYIKYRRGRSRIFDHLKDWGHEFSIVFIGHSLQVPDLRTLLLELDELGELRPRYYAVTPDVNPVQERYWNSKRVTLLAGTFGDFMRSLDTRIAPIFSGGVAAPRRAELPISERFARKDASLSETCVQFLQLDCVYVRSSTATESVAPSEFYKGFSPGWSAISQNLDVRRDLSDTILADYFLTEESAHSEMMELVVIKAHAGAGQDCHA